MRKQRKNRETASHLWSAAALLILGGSVADLAAATDLTAQGVIANTETLAGVVPGKNASPSPFVDGLTEDLDDVTSKTDGLLTFNYRDSTDFLGVHAVGTFVADGFTVKEVLFVGSQDTDCTAKKIAGAKILTGLVDEDILETLTLENLTDYGALVANANESLDVDTADGRYRSQFTGDSNVAMVMTDVAFNPNNLDSDECLPDGTLSFYSLRAYDQYSYRPKFVSEVSDYANIADATQQVVSTDADGEPAILAELIHTKTNSIKGRTGYYSQIGPDPQLVISTAHAPMRIRTVSIVDAWYDDALTSYTQYKVRVIPAAAEADEAALECSGTNGPLGADFYCDYDVSDTIGIAIGVDTANSAYHSGSDYLLALNQVSLYPEDYPCETSTANDMEGNASFTIVHGPALDNVTDESWDGIVDIRLADLDSEDYYFIQIQPNSPYSLFSPELDAVCAGKTATATPPTIPTELADVLTLMESPEFFNYESWTYQLDIAAARALAVGQSFTMDSTITTATTTLTFTLTIDMGLCDITETGDLGAIDVEISKTVLEAQTVTVENRFVTPTTDVTYALLKSDGDPIVDFEGNDASSSVTLVLNDAGDEFTITIPYGFYGLWDPDQSQITVEMQDDVMYWQIVATSCATTFPDNSITFTPDYSVTLTMAINECFTLGGWFDEDWDNGSQSSTTVVLKDGPNAGVDVAIASMTWVFTGGASDCDAISATLVTYINGQLQDSNYAFSELTGTNAGGNLQLTVAVGALDGTELGGVYTFFMKFTLADFPGTAEWIVDATEIATTTVTRGCFNIDADDMDITCDGATDLQYYVPVNTGPVEIYLNSCTFNTNYDDVCSNADQDPRQEYFQIFVYKDGQEAFADSWGFWEDKDGDRTWMDSWFATTLVAGTDVDNDEVLSYYWQGPHSIITTDDADKGVYVFQSLYKRKFYADFGVEFALDDPITATVTIRDLCFAPGAELLDITYDVDVSFTYDQGEFEIWNVLSAGDATMSLDVPRYQNSDITTYTQADSSAIDDAECGAPQYEITYVLIDGEEQDAIPTWMTVSNAATPTVRLYIEGANWASGDLLMDSIVYGLYQVYLKVTDEMDTTVEIVPEYPISFTLGDPCSTLDMSQTSAATFSGNNIFLKSDTYVDGDTWDASEGAYSWSPLACFTDSVLFTDIVYKDGVDMGEASYAWINSDGTVKKDLLQATDPEGGVYTTARKYYLDLTTYPDIWVEDNLIGFTVISEGCDTATLDYYNGDNSILDTATYTLWTKALDLRVPTVTIIDSVSQAAIDAAASTASPLPASTRLCGPISIQSVTNDPSTNESDFTYDYLTSEIVFLNGDIFSQAEGQVVVDAVFQLDQYTSQTMTVTTLLTIDFTEGGFGAFIDLADLNYDDEMPVCETTTDPLTIGNPGFNGNDFEDLYIWWTSTGMSLTVTEAMMQDQYVNYVDTITGYQDFCGTFIEGDLEVYQTEEPYDGIFRSTAVGISYSDGVSMLDPAIGATFTEGADGGTIDFTLADFYPGRYSLGRKLTRSDDSVVSYVPVFHFLIAEECGLATEIPTTTTEENIDIFTSTYFPDYDATTLYTASPASYEMKVYPMEEADLAQSVTVPGQVATCGAMLQTRSLKINGYGISSIAEQWMYAGKNVRSVGFVDNSVSLTVVNTQGWVPEFTSLELQVNSYFIEDSTTGVTWSQEDNANDLVEFTMVYDYCIIGNTLSIVNENDNQKTVTYAYNDGAVTYTLPEVTDAWTQAGGKAPDGSACQYEYKFVELDDTNFDLWVSNDEGASPATMNIQMGDNTDQNDDYIATSGSFVASWKVRIVGADVWVTQQVDPPAEAPMLDLADFLTVTVETQCETYSLIPVYVQAASGGGSDLTDVSTNWSDTTWEPSEIVTNSEMDGGKTYANLPSGFIDSKTWAAIHTDGTGTAFLSSAETEVQCSYLYLHNQGGYATTYNDIIENCYVTEDGNSEEDCSTIFDQAGTDTNLVEFTSTVDLNGIYYVHDNWNVYDSGNQHTFVISITVTDGTASSEKLQILTLTSGSSCVNEIVWQTDTPGDYLVTVSSEFIVGTTTTVTNLEYPTVSSQTQVSGNDCYSDVTAIVRTVTVTRQSDGSTEVDPDGTSSCFNSAFDDSGTIKFQIQDDCTADQIDTYVVSLMFASDYAYVETTYEIANFMPITIKGTNCDDATMELVSMPIGGEWETDIFTFGYGVTKELQLPTVRDSVSVASGDPDVATCGGWTITPKVFLNDDTADGQELDPVPAWINIYYDTAWKIQFNADADTANIQADAGTYSISLNYQSSVYPTMEWGATTPLMTDGTLEYIVVEIADVDCFSGDFTITTETAVTTPQDYSLTTTPPAAITWTLGVWIPTAAITYDDELVCGDSVTGTMAGIYQGTIGSAFADATLVTQDQVVTDTFTESGDDLSFDPGADTAEDVYGTWWFQTSLTYQGEGYTVDDWLVVNVYNPCDLATFTYDIDSWNAAETLVIDGTPLQITLATATLDVITAGEDCGAQTVELVVTNTADRIPMSEDELPIGMFTLSQTNNPDDTLTIETSNLADRGEYTISVKYSYADYNLEETVDITTLTVATLCEAATVEVVSQNDAADLATNVIRGIAVYDYWFIPTVTDDASEASGYQECGYYDAEIVVNDADGTPIETPAWLVLYYHLDDAGEDALTITMGEDAYSVTGDAGFYQVNVQYTSQVEPTLTSTVPMFTLYLTTEVDCSSPVFVATTDTAEEATIDFVTADDATAITLTVPTYNIQAAIDFFQLDVCGKIFAEFSDVTFLGDAVGSTDDSQWALITDDELTGEVDIDDEWQNITFLPLVASSYYGVWTFTVKVEVNEDSENIQLSQVTVYHVCSYGNEIVLTDTESIADTQEFVVTVTSAITFSLPTFTNTKFSDESIECGAITPTLKVTGDLPIDPYPETLFPTFDGSSLVVDTDLLSDRGTYTVEIVYSLDTYVTVTKTLSLFTLTVKHYCDVTTLDTVTAGSETDTLDTIKYRGYGVSDKWTLPVIVDAETLAVDADAVAPTECGTISQVLTMTYHGEEYDPIMSWNADWLEDNGSGLLALYGSRTAEDNIAGDFTVSMVYTLDAHQEVTRTIDFFTLKIVDTIDCTTGDSWAFTPETALTQNEVHYIEDGGVLTWTVPTPTTQKAIYFGDYEVCGSYDFVCNVELRKSSDYISITPGGGSKVDFQLSDLTYITSDDTTVSWSLNLTTADVLSTATIGTYVFYASFASDTNNSHLNGVSGSGDGAYVMLTTVIDYRCIDNSLVVDGYEEGQEFQFAITDTSEPLVITLPGVIDQKSLDAGSSQCGDITKEVQLVHEDGVSADLDTPAMLFDSDELTITVDTSDDSLRGTYTIYVTYTLAEHQGISTWFNYAQLTIVNPCIDNNELVISSLLFAVDQQRVVNYSPELVVDTPTVTNLAALQYGDDEMCGTTQYSYTLYSIDPTTYAQTDVTANFSFITLADDFTTFSVVADDVDNAQSYYVEMEYSLSGYPDLTVTQEFMWLDIIDMCSFDTQEIVLGSYTELADQTFYFGASDPITFVLPTARDQASITLGQTDFCGAVESTLVVYKGADAGDGGVEQTGQAIAFIIPDGDTETLYFATNDRNDLGEFYIYMEYTLPAPYTAITLEQYFMYVNLIDACELPNGNYLTSSGTTITEDQLFIVGDETALSLPLPTTQTTWAGSLLGQADICGDVTPTIRVKQDGSYISTPGFITFDDDAQPTAVQVTTDQVSDRGTYVIKIEWALGSYYTNVVLTETLATVEVVNNCEDYNEITTVYADDYVATQTFILNQDDPIVVSLPTLSDTYSTIMTVESCGSITATEDVTMYGNTVTQNWVSYSSADATVTINPPSGTTTGTYVISMTYQLQQYTDVTLTETLVTLTVVDKCTLAEGNYLTLGPSTVETPQDFTIFVSDALELPIPTIEDNASVVAETTSFCGSITATAKLFIDGTETAINTLNYVTEANSGDLTLNPDQSSYAGYYVFQVDYVLDDYDAVTLSTTLAVVTVIDPCTTGNYLIPSTSASATETFVIGTSEAIVVTYPTVTDYATTTYDSITDQCGTITTTLTIFDEDEEILDTEPVFMTETTTVDNSGDTPVTTTTVTIEPTLTSQRGGYGVGLQHAMANHDSVTLLQIPLLLEVVDNCVDNNSIVLGSTSFDATQDFILSYTSAIVIDLPTQSDAKSNANSDLSCGNITPTVTVELEDEVISKPSFITVNTVSNTLTFNPTGTQATGTYLIHVTYTLDDYDDITLETKNFLTVELYNYCAENNSIVTSGGTILTDVTSYTIGSGDSIVLNYPTAVDAASTTLDETSFCGSMLTTVVISRDGNQQFIEPNAITSDNTAGTVTFETSTISDAGYYLIEIQFTLINYSDVTTTVQLATIDAINTCTYENGNAISIADSTINTPQDYTINVDTTVTYTPPVPSDLASDTEGTDNFCGNYVTTMIIEKDGEVVTNAVTFITYNSFTNTIEVGTTQVGNRGTYSISMRHYLLTYSSVIVTQHILDLNVIDVCSDTVTLTLGTTNHQRTDFIIGFTPALELALSTITDSQSTDDNPLACGTYSYSITNKENYIELEESEFNSYITIDAANELLTYNPTDKSIGNRLQQLSVTYYLTDYPSVSETLDFVDINLINACNAVYGNEISATYDAAYPQAEEYDFTISADTDPIVITLPTFTDAASTVLETTDFCGAITITYTYSKDGVDQDAQPDFMRFNIELTELTIGSSDTNYEGVWVVTMVAMLDDWRQVVTYEPIVQVSMIDDCVTDNSIVVADMTTEVDQTFYIGYTAAMDVVLPAATLASNAASCGDVVPSVEIKLAGSALATADQDALSTLSQDADTLEWSLTFAPTATTATGVYTVEITYSLGGLTYFQTFLVATVIDVCVTGNTIVPGEQTVTSPTTYTIPWAGCRDDCEVLEITLAAPTDYASSLTTADFCGTISTYVIVEDDEGTEVTNPSWMYYSPINSKIFIEESDEAERGSFTITLRHVLDDYDTITIDESLMTLNIVTECADSNSIVWPANYNASPQTFIDQVTDDIIVTLGEVWDAVSLSIEFPYQTYCFDIEYELSYTYTGSDGETTTTTGTWPSAITYDDNLPTDDDTGIEWTVNMDGLDAGTYTLSIKASASVASGAAEDVTDTLELMTIELENACTFDDNALVQTYDVAVTTPQTYIIDESDDIIVYKPTVTCQAAIDYDTENLCGNVVTTYSYIYYNDANPDGAPGEGLPVFANTYADDSYDHVIFATSDTAYRATYEIYIAHTLELYPEEDYPNLKIAMTHFVTISVTQGCIDNNSIILGDFSDVTESPMVYVINYDGELVFNLPSYSDSVSDSLDIRNYCGAYTVTAKVYYENTNDASFADMTGDSVTEDNTGLMTLDTDDEYTITISAEDITTPGQYWFTISVALTDYSDTVVLTDQVVIHLDVVDACADTTIVFGASSITTVQYFVIDQSSDIVVDWPSIAAQASIDLDVDNFCGDITVTTASVWTDDAGVDQTETLWWVTLDENEETLTLTNPTADSDEAGTTYQVKLIATLDNGVTGNMVLFTVQIQHPCITGNSIFVLTQDTLSATNNLIVGASDYDYVYATLPTVLNTAAQTDGNIYYCGETLATTWIYKDEDYETKVTPGFIVWDADANDVTIQPTSSDDRGEYELGITYSLVSYPDVELDVELGTVVVTDQCVDGNSIVTGSYTATSQTFVLSEDTEIEVAMPTFEDQASINNNVEGLCGDITVSLTATYTANQYSDTVAYDLDAVETDGKTWFVMKGDSTKVTFTPTVANTPTGTYVFSLSYVLDSYTTVTLEEVLITIEVTDQCAINNEILTTYPSVLSGTQAYTIGISSPIVVELPTYTDLVSQTLGITDFCGTITMTYWYIDPAGNEVKTGAEYGGDLPGIANYVEYTNTIEIETDDVTQRGTWTIYATFEMDTYTTVQLDEQLVSFTISDTCVDSNSIVVNYPADYTGSYNYIIQTSADISETLPTISNTAADASGNSNLCGSSSISMSVLKDNEVMESQSLFTMTDTAIEFSDRSADNRGTYQIKLTYTLDEFPTDVTLEQTYMTVTVTDICVDQNSLVTSANSDAEAAYEFLIETSSAITVSYPTVTDQQSETNGISEICGAITRTLSVVLNDQTLTTAEVDALTWIEQGTDDAGVTILPTSFNDRGVYVISFTYTMALYTALTTTVDITTLTVLDPCVDGNSIIVQSASDASVTYDYVLQTSGSIYATLPTVVDQYGFSLYVESDTTTWDRCGTITQNLYVTKDGDRVYDFSTTNVDWMGIDFDNNDMTIQTTDVNDRGVWVISIAYVLSSPYTDVTLTETITTLTVSDSCIDGNELTVTQTDVYAQTTYLMSVSDALIVNYPLDSSVVDTMSTTSGIASVCGLVTSDLQVTREGEVITAPGWIEDDFTSTITLSTTSIYSRGTYVLSQVYKLADYEDVTTTVDIITVVIEHPCVDGNTLTISEASTVETPYDYVMYYTTLFQADMPTVEDTYSLSVKTDTTVSPFCGNLTPTLVITKDTVTVDQPDWISINADGENVDIDTEEYANKGTWTISVTYTLDDYSLFSDDSIALLTFTVNHPCEYDNSIVIETVSAVDYYNYYVVEDDRVYFQRPVVTTIVDVWAEESGHGTDFCGGVGFTQNEQIDGVAATWPDGLYGASTFQLDVATGEDPATRVITYETITYTYCYGGDEVYAESCDEDLLSFGTDDNADVGTYSASLTFFLTTFTAIQYEYDWVVFEVAENTLVCDDTNTFLEVEASDQGYLEIYVIGESSDVKADWPVMMDYVSVYRAVDNYCGDITVSLQVEQDDDVLSTIPDFISLNTYQSQVWVRTDDSADVGEYKIVLIFTLDNYPDVQLNIDFMQLIVADAEEEVEELVEEALDEEITVPEVEIPEEEEDEEPEPVDEVVAPEGPTIVVPVYAGISNAKMSDTNEVTITLSTNVKTNSDFAGMKGEALKSRYIAMSDERPSGYDYSIESFSGNQITIQYEFDDPLLVSQGEIMDSMEIKLYKPYFLRDADAEDTSLDMTKLGDSSMYVTVRVPINKRFPSVTQAQAVQATGAAVGTATTAAVVAPVAVQAAASNVMSGAWPLVNQMQMVSILMFVQDDVPSNTQSITDGFSGVANFQIIPAETVAGWFGFGKTVDTTDGAATARRLQEVETEAEAVAEGDAPAEVTQEDLLLAQNGQDSDFMIFNYWIFFFVFGFLAFLVFITDKIQTRFADSLSDRMKGYINKFRGLIMYSAFLRYMLISYQIMLMNSLVSFTYFANRKASFLQVIFALVTVGLLGFFLYWQYKFLRDNKDKLEQKEFRARYGSLYENLDVGRPERYGGNFTLLGTTLHCVRRIATVIVIRWFAGMPYFQIPVLALLIQGQILWILKYWPMDREILNWLHLFNEFMLLLMIYIVLGFSGAGGDASSVYSMGTVMATVVILLVLANVAILVMDLVQFFKNRKRRQLMQEHGDKMSAKVAQKPKTSVADSLGFNRPQKAKISSRIDEDNSQAEAGSVNADKTSVKDNKAEEDLDDIMNDSKNQDKLVDVDEKEKQTDRKNETAKKSENAARPSSKENPVQQPVERKATKKEDVLDEYEQVLADQKKKDEERVKRQSTRVRAPESAEKTSPDNNERKKSAERQRSAERQPVERQRTQARDDRREQYERQKTRAEADRKRESDGQAKKDGERNENNERQRDDRRERYERQRTRAEGQDRSSLERQKTQHRANDSVASSQKLIDQYEDRQRRTNTREDADDKPSNTFKPRESSKDRGYERQRTNQPRGGNK